MINYKIVQRVTAEGVAETHLFKRWLEECDIPFEGPIDKYVSSDKYIFELGPEVDITKGILYVARKKVFPQYKHGIPKPGDTVVFKEKSVNTIVFGQKRLVIERVEEAVSGDEVVHFVGFKGLGHKIYNWSFIDKDVVKRLIQL